MTDAKELCEKQLAGGRYALVLACMADACALQSEEEALAGANVMSAGANAAADAYLGPLSANSSPRLRRRRARVQRAAPDDAFSRCYKTRSAAAGTRTGSTPLRRRKCRPLRHRRVRGGVGHARGAVGPAARPEARADEGREAAPADPGGGGEKRRTRGRTALAAALEGGQCPESEEECSMVRRVQGVADQVLRRLQGDAARCGSPRSAPAPGVQCRLRDNDDVRQADRRRAGAGARRRQLAQACFIVSMAEECPSAARASRRCASRADCGGGLRMCRPCVDGAAPGGRSTACAARTWGGRRRAG